MQYLFVLLTLFTLLACNAPQDTSSSAIQTGDLLFQQWDQSDFAKAINAVTAGVDGADFAHVGLVLMMEDSLQVLEAVTGAGVVLRPLDQFLAASQNAQGKPRVCVGRLQQDFSTSIPAINDWALSKVGLPYDTLFIYGNEKYYCSELIHDAFNTHVPGGDVFHLEPMTFKDPATKAYFPVWVDYFSKYDTPIPEGELGINPGLMSRSSKIDIVDKLWE